MKFLLTKEMYVRLRDFDETVALANSCSDDVILCVTGAYRMVDGTPVVVEVESVGKGLR
jgi:hypothetical protein